MPLSLPTIIAIIFTGQNGTCRENSLLCDLRTFRDNSLLLLLLLLMMMTLLSLSAYWCIYWKNCIQKALCSNARHLLLLPPLFSLLFYPWNFFSFNKTPDMHTNNRHNTYATTTSILRANFSLQQPLLSYRVLLVVVVVFSFSFQYLFIIVLLSSSIL